MKGPIMGYQRPSATSAISDSWQGHKNRRPPSQEPGTDYPCAYGSSIVAPFDGTVAEVKTSSSGATGRFVTIDFVDGRRARALHLSRVLVSAGQKVTRGQEIAKSGASANGRDWGVGAHVHETLFPSHRYVFGPNGTLDFERYVGAGGSASFVQVVADRQNYLNAARGERLVVDGLFGAATRDAIKRYQTYLKSRGWYTGAIDGDWGAGTQAGHDNAYAEWVRATQAPPAPQFHTATVADIASLPNTRGLQKIARLYGYKGAFDNQFGASSRAGMQAFLNHNYGGSLAAWLRAKWGYVGNDQWGPVMAAAATRADTANWAAL
ncbi:peptidoglycan DD-metalloendopeptidase family protein [Microbacterium sp. MYb62]|uniref:peptidoglycan DD-metalloendopeptidase family protein n=1 Tax=Microbacterium sp. MYb62 TaxID=1848690 RepID=UPI000CFC10B6|nr:peptidoglycan DD-metalloendopeptidase family protein [Microbacterium sp. MYb62]PRB14454.1 hypothetical protein CQ042_11075 [Microbacterium sp. MYb62]